MDVDQYLGETPIWSPAEQALWWVNCEQPPEIHRWTPATGAHDVWPMPNRVGGFVHKADGTLLVGLADGLYDFDPPTNALSLRVASPLPEHVKLHECHCDRQGRFWIGTLDHHFPADRSAAGGCYFRLDGDVLTRVIDNITVSNGLAFSPDGRTMYAANTPRRTVQAYDLDPETGELSGARTFISLAAEDRGHIDGATVDADGGYWLTLVGQAELRRYLPDGTLDRTITLPFSNPTKPAFGGPDLATLYVTSTKMKVNVDAPGFDRNGGVFALHPGERGVLETPFRGDLSAHAPV
ncbi:SMP-30/gluconolactonase/LRE family protein [Sphingomonas natans]|uniref:SMP-30/gluconolactonase/LRE family protein n=1 Tax=Sphingomonas natans TaxID=3063330 RepID=UPI0026E3810B|nr:SMP-30/gluconolactonase/LRE family protein [Sphingomonas sp. BIUV-7]